MQYNIPLLLFQNYTSNCVKLASDLTISLELCDEIFVYNDTGTLEKHKLVEIDENEATYIIDNNETYKIAISLCFATQDGKNECDIIKSCDIINKCKIASVDLVEKYINNVRVEIAKISCIKNKLFDDYDLFNNNKIEHWRKHTTFYSEILDKKTTHSFINYHDDFTLNECEYLQQIMKHRNKISNDKFKQIYNENNGKLYAKSKNDIICIYFISRIYDKMDNYVNYLNEVINTIKLRPYLISYARYGHYFTGDFITFDEDIQNGRYCKIFKIKDPNGSYVYQNQNGEQNLKNGTITEIVYDGKWNIRFNTDCNSYELDKEITIKHNNMMKKVGIKIQSNDMPKTRLVCKSDNIIEI